MIDREKLEEAVAFYGDGNFPEIFDTILRSARAHLATLPKVKMVDVWHVEFVAELANIPNVYVCGDKVIAEARAISFRERGHRCVRITGPHTHQMPVA